MPKYVTNKELTIEYLDPAHGTAYLTINKGTEVNGSPADGFCLETNGIGRIIISAGDVTQIEK